MTQPPNDASHHLHDARLATEEGDFVAARSHIGAAKSAGAAEGLVRAAMQAVDDAERGEAKTGAAQLYGAMALAGIAYIALSFFGPPRVGLTLWAFIALFAVPLILGAIVGRSVPHHGAGSTRFWRGFWLCLLVVFFYSVGNMGWARHELSTPVTGGVYGIIFVAAMTYGLVAGVIAGFSASKFGKQGVSA